MLVSDTASQGTKNKQGYQFSDGCLIALITVKLQKFNDGGNLKNVSTEGKEVTSLTFLVIV